MHCASFGRRLTPFLFGLLGFAVLVETLFLSVFFLPAVGSPLGSLLWYLFAFISGAGAAGILFVVPFVTFLLPLLRRHSAFVAVPTFLALSAGLFLSLFLSGLIIAFFGREILSLLPHAGNTLKYWIYFLVGVFVYTLALGELGLIRLRLSSYSKRLPRFTEGDHRIASGFFLGLFFGSVGVLSAYPAIPLLLVEAATSGSVEFGAALLGMHALGRVSLLFLVVVLALSGVPVLRRLTRYHEFFLRMNGVFTLLVSSFIITLGVFGHQWWTGTTLFQTLSSFLRSENFVLDDLGKSIFFLIPHYAPILLILLIVIPVWWSYVRHRMRVYGSPEAQLVRLSLSIDELHLLRRRLEMTVFGHEKERVEHLSELEERIETLEKERKIYQDAGRYGRAHGLSRAVVGRVLREELESRLVLAVTVSVLVLVLSFILL